MAFSVKLQGHFRSSLLGQVDNPHPNFLSIFQTTLKNRTVTHAKLFTPIWKLFLSSLHWVDLGFLYALLVQWSICNPSFRLCMRNVVVALQCSLYLTLTCYFNSPLFGFWLTMTSQIESIRSTYYTPLYKNKFFESRSSQWRLLLIRYLARHFKLIWWPNCEVQVTLWAYKKLDQFII